MKALIITESYLPAVGGVERHLALTMPYLKRAGLEIEVISKKDLLGKHKNKKFLTLLQIYLALLRKIKSIQSADIIFIHDVFIYFLPFRFLFPDKRVVTIFHGFEKVFPIPAKNIFYKKLAQKLSTKTISIGHYINKHYGLSEQNNYISYGAVELPSKEVRQSDKIQNSFLFVGRLEEDTGLSIFLAFLDILLAKKDNFTVKFCGDGPLKTKCQKYGQVLGFVPVQKHLRKSTACFAGGYLSALEAMAYKNLVLTAHQHSLKKDYWLDSPLADAVVTGRDAQELYQNYLVYKKRSRLIEQNYQLSKQHTLQNLVNLYLALLPKG